MNRFGRKVIIAAGLVATALGGAVTSASAAADAPVGGPWNASTQPAAPIAGVPWRLTVAGDTSALPAGSPAGPDVAAAAVVSESVISPQSFSEVAGATASQTWRTPAGSPGSFSKSVPFTFDKPGRFRVCAYFGREAEGSIDDTVEATLVRFPPFVFEVVRPSVASTVTLPGVLVAGSVARLSGDVSTDAPENIEFHLNARDAACAPTAGSNAPSNRFAPAATAEYVYGPAYRVVQEVGLPSVVGDYRLCTYAFRATRPADPDLVADSAASGQFLSVVLPAPVRSVRPVIYGDGTAGTKQVRCRMVRVVITRGKSVQVRCPGVSGQLVVAFRHRGTKPGSVTRIVRLDRNGNAAISTRGLPRGIWHSTMKWSGFLANESRFAIR